MTVNDVVNDFLAKYVPVSDYQLEAFARNVLETFLYVALELDPAAEVTSLK